MNFEELPVLKDKYFIFTFEEDELRLKYALELKNDTYKNDNLSIFQHHLNKVFNTSYFDREIAKYIVSEVFAWRGDHFGEMWSTGYSFHFLSQKQTEFFDLYGQQTLAAYSDMTYENIDLCFENISLFGAGPMTIFFQVIDTFVFCINGEAMEAFDLTPVIPSDTEKWSLLSERHTQTAKREVFRKIKDFIESPLF